MTRAELINEIKTKKTFLCVGLDPDVDKIPQFLLEEALKFGFYNKRNSWFDSSGDYVGKLWNIDGKQLIIK